jgi:hypothetical protein
MAKNAFSDDSVVSIPLRNLISILGAVAISTWAYYGIIERLNTIEHEMGVHWEEIEENDDWIDNFEPPREVRETVSHVRDLERQIAVLQYQVQQLSK